MMNEEFVKKCSRKKVSPEKNTSNVVQQFLAKLKTGEDWLNKKAEDMSQSIQGKIYELLRIFLVI